MGDSPFVLLGVQHLAALAVVALLCALTAAAVRSSDPRGRAWVGRLIGAAFVVYVAITYRALWRARGLLAAHDLPLELCDLVTGLCVVSCFSRHRPSFELAYFWGLAGTAQALLTPDLSAGFPSWWFIQFFTGHGLVIVAITYGLAVGLRPAPGGWLRALAAINAYLLVVGAIDHAFGWNYGYLCQKPGQPSLLDHLGPWPWYILSLEGIAAASFILLELPWRGRRNPPK